MEFSIYFQDGGEVFFRIKSSATLRKLMNAYCERQSVDSSSMAFLFDGRRLRADQTPAEVLAVAFHVYKFCSYIEYTLYLSVQSW